MTALPILYSFRRCPYAIRARMALLVSGTAFEVREVSLRDKPAELVEASPKATVPVLVLPGGEVIDESIDIMRWALARGDPEHWLGGDDGAVIATIDGPFKYHLDRAKYPERHASDADVHRAACLDLLVELDARLVDTAYLCGDHRALSDIAAMPFVRQFAAIDRDWFDAQPLPGVRGWLDRLTGSALFDRAMVRLTPWRRGDAPIRW